MMARLLRVLALLRDPRTPTLPRLAVLLAVIYLISPVDLIPEAVVPVFGWLDDITVVWLALRWLIRSAPVASTDLLPPAQP